MTWRDTLFVWKGRVQRDLGLGIIFEGTWLGVQAGAADPPVKIPGNDAFAKSAMDFFVSGTLDEQCEKIGESCSYQLTQGKGWLLDDMEYHQDQVHHVHFYKWRANTCLVFAYGTNAYGDFIASGTSDAAALGSNVSDVFEMTLARRYLEDGDARSQWTYHDRPTLGPLNTEQDSADLWNAPHLVSTVFPRARVNKRKRGVEAKTTGSATTLVPVITQVHSDDSASDGE